MASLAGMQYSRGDAVIVMDVDMQDPPELVGQMVAKWREGYDVVLPQRTRRTGEPWIKRIVAETGYKVINKIADVRIPPNTGDFRLMSRRVVDEVVRLKESHGFLRGMVAVVGFKQCLLPFERPARFSGETNYNRFFGSLRIGFNGIFCFSTYALTLSTQFGFVIAGVSFLIAIAYLIMKLCGFPFPVGNPTLVILILFMGGIQLISVGILGEYIGRIYEEVRARPRFIVDRAEGFAGKITDHANRKVAQGPAPADRGAEADQRRVHEALARAASEPVRHRREVQPQLPGEALPAGLPGHASRSARAWASTSTTRR